MGGAPGITPTDDTMGVGSGGGIGVIELELPYLMKISRTMIKN